MITLPKPGDEGYDESRKLQRRRPYGRVPITVSIAWHAPIAHILGHPCIYFQPKVPWHRYPLVHERNVVPILIHEAVHCVLMKVGEAPQHGKDGIHMAIGGMVR